MQDVTWTMETYRECVRHLWNTYFVPLRDDEATEFMWRTEELLFSYLVIWQLGRPSFQENVTVPFPLETRDLIWRKDDLYIPYLRIIPDIPPLGLEVHSEDPPSLIRLHSATIDLRFINFFDYDVAPSKHRNWTYYRAYVLQCLENPSLDGSIVLINIPDSNIRIVFLETDEEREPSYPIKLDAIDD